MKRKIDTLSIFAFIAFLCITLLTGCEQTDLEPALDTASGGGTLNTYKAYTLDSIPGAGRIYGRVVFWKDNVNRTLVQVSVYNTAKDAAYPTALYSGTVAGGSVTRLLPLYSVDGTKGEFSTYKFYIIEDSAFYGSLDSYDAHLNIFSGVTLVATGNIGKNAKPVEAK